MNWQLCFLDAAASACLLWCKGLLAAVGVSLGHSTNLCVLQAFADILSSSETFSAPMDETYKMLDVDPSSITTLESYLQEYYTNIMKKLKQAGAQSRQSDFYV